MYESEHFPSGGIPQPSGVSTVSFCLCHSFAILKCGHSSMFDPECFSTHDLLFLQIDVPEGIPVDEVMKRFKNESRRVNTVTEVRPCTKPFSTPSTFVCHGTLQLACLDGRCAIIQVRRRRYFENYQDYLKRKEKQKHMNKRMCAPHVLLLPLVVSMATAG